MSFLSRNRVNLTTGETHKLRLPGRGTAGFNWSVEVDGDAESVEIKLAPDSLIDQPSAREGESPDEVMTIKAIRPGKAILRLQQRRPWEKKRKPLDERDIHVDVSA